MFSRKFVIVLTVLIAVAGAVMAQGTAGENACSAIVRAAMESTDALCGDTTRNHACYGHVLNVAEFRAGGDYVFEVQGDKAPLDRLQSLDLSPLDLDLEQWGVVLLQAQANLPDQLPGQNVTFLLFGDVALENAVGGTVEVETTTILPARIHIAPGDNRAVIAGLPVGSPLIATGKYFNPAGKIWIRVSQTSGSGLFGWLESGAVDVALADLPDINPNESAFNPMQAFYFRTGIGAPQCIEVPRDGMLIQTPHGVGKVEFTVNGFTMKLGSTVYLNLPEDGASTCLSLLDGEMELTSGDVTVVVKPGQQSCIPMDENGIASGPPSAPNSFDASEVGRLSVVLSGLPADVTIPPPAPSNTPTPLPTRRPPTATPVPTEMPTNAPAEPPANPPPPTAVPSLPPVASFSYSLSAMTFTFTDTSTNAPASWAWDFGDGNVSTAQNPTHVYPSTWVVGSTPYTVTLTVCNASGCDTATQAHTLPNCNFDLTQNSQLHIQPSPQMCPGETYMISLLDATCASAGIDYPVDFYTINTIEVADYIGRGFQGIDTVNNVVLLTAALNSPGPLTLNVGTNDCS